MNKSDLWRKWTVNCAIGELLGIASAGGTAFFINSAVGEPIEIESKLIVLLAMMFAGFLEGTILSYFQWKVLVTKFSKVPRREWFLYTVLVGVLGWFLGMLPSLFFAPTTNASDGVTATLGMPNPLFFLVLSVGSGFVLGAIFGLFQWFSLRKYAKSAYKWIIANALGWGLGLFWIYLFASIPQESSSIFFSLIMGMIGGALAGLSLGAITGWFLLRMEVK